MTPIRTKTVKPLLSKHRSETSVDKQVAVANPEMVKLHKLLLEAEDEGRKLNSLVGELESELTVQKGLQQRLNSDVRAAQTAQRKAEEERDSVKLQLKGEQWGNGCASSVIMLWMITSSK